MSNPLSILSKIQSVSSFLSELENGDANKNGTADFSEMKAIGAKILADAAKLQADAVALAGDCGQLEQLAAAYVPQLKHLLGGP